MKGFIAVVTALATLGFAQSALAQPGQFAVCPKYDGKFEVGRGWEGSPAAGITVSSANDGSIVVQVADGYTLVRLCYKTGVGGGGATSLDVPIAGPATFTISRTAVGGGLSHVTFDTEKVQQPADVCPNLDGVQTSMPQGLIKDAYGRCVPVEQPPPPIDVCPNIAGIQLTVPAGMIRLSSGACSVQQHEAPPAVTDVCPNIEGHQTTVPAVLVKDASGNCVAPTVTVAATPVVQGSPVAAPALPSVVTPKAAPKAKKKAKQKAKRKLKKKKLKRKVKRAVKSRRAARPPRVLPFTP
jgi:hypothetical protein